MPFAGRPYEVAMQEQQNHMCGKPRQQNSFLPGMQPGLNGSLTQGHAVQGTHHQATEDQ